MKHTIITIDIATHGDFDPREPYTLAFHSLIERLDKTVDEYPEEFEDWKTTVTFEEREI